MDKSERKSYESAGRIHRSAMKRVHKTVQVDKKLLDIATELEAFVFKEIAKAKQSGGLAFPINLSVNNQAAHATPAMGDETVLNETDLLKVDIGVHIDGFIADGAVSINFSNDYAKLIEANQTALEAALSVARPNADITKIGETVAPIVEKAGFKVVSNLTGHGLQKFKQHAPPSIPNTPNNSAEKMADGLALAIEPFVTNGRGAVADSSTVEIFSVEEEKPVRDASARKILEFARQKFDALPFAERQLQELGLSDFARKVGLRELVKAKVLHAYPVLVEQKGAVVSQAEKTVIIDGDEAIVIN